MDLEIGDRLSVISGPRHGERGEVMKVTACMYQVKFDDTSVSRVWKSNIQTLLRQERPSPNVALGTGTNSLTHTEQLQLQCKLKEAAKRLHETSEEIKFLTAKLQMTSLDT
jgi:hypothetical protein